MVSYITTEEVNDKCGLSKYVPDLSGIEVERDLELVGTGDGTTSHTLNLYTEQKQYQTPLQKA